ncbi:MAG: hypothetical protein RID07_14165, partial [Lacipirellulaceae bacterium]
FGADSYEKGGIITSQPKSGQGQSLDSNRKIQGTAQTLAMQTGQNRLIKASPKENTRWVQAPTV